MDPHYEKQINCLLDTFLLEENKEKRYKLMYEIEEFYKQNTSFYLTITF